MWMTGRILSRTSGFGFGGGGPGDRDPLAAVVFAAALGDARRLAPAAAQVVQLGTPHRPAPHHLDRADPRRIERKDALDPLAVRDLAQREVRVDPGVLAGDAHPLEGLDAFALALDDAHADPDRVARLKRRHRPLAGQFGDLLGFELLQQIHRFTSLSLAACRRLSPIGAPNGAATDPGGAPG